MTDPRRIRLCLESNKQGYICNLIIGHEPHDHEARAFNVDGESTYVAASWPVDGEQ